MTRLTPLATMAMVAALGVAASAKADTLTFVGPICDTPGNVCANFSSILQTYGDVAGQLDVQYDSDISNPGVSPFRYWADQYSGLFDVAFGEVGSTVEIYLQPLSGYRITLLGFDIGSYTGLPPTVDHESQVTILGGDGSPILSTGPTTIFGNAPTHFAPGLTRSDGFRIQFGPDAFDVGIDNINFELTAVPEPSTWAMMILGFGAAGSMIRRRRAAIAS